MSATVIADLIKRVGKPPAGLRDLHFEADLLRALFGPDVARWPVEVRSIRFAPMVSADDVLDLVERFRSQGIASIMVLASAYDRVASPGGLDCGQPLAPQLARALLIEFLTALQSQTPGPTGASNEGDANA